ncbi:MAG: TlpA disulfide reductase family protein [Comamonadaceae bacterium]|nr:TlpA disulfide reductase family protein [Comamonadaceae bacterium]
MPAPSSPSEARGRGQARPHQRLAARLSGWAAGAALLTCAAALAQSGPAAPPADAARPARPWSFELAALDGSRFVRASDLPGPVLLNFWGRDCPPCIAELPMLEQFARRHPQWTVLLVATDTPRQAAQFLQRRGITLPALRGGAQVAALMKSAGNARGALPFTVALQGGAICRTHTGMLSAAELQALAADCAKPQRLPAAQRL